MRFKLVANNLGKCLVSILFSSMSVCEFKSVEVLRRHMLGEDYLLVLLVNDLLQPEQTLDLASIQVSQEERVLCTFVEVDSGSLCIETLD